MREPLGWPDVEVRPTPYRDANGDIDVRAYERRLPPLLCTAITVAGGVLCWIGLIGAVIWGVFLVTP